MSDDEDLRAQLERLEAEERSVSAQRSRLHERLSSFSNSVVQEQERELSERRRVLHDEIDRLRGLLDGS